MSSSGYLLIADISGYTDFVKLHNLRKKAVVGKFLADNFEFHAEAIVSDLLEAVIEVVEPTLKLNKLEGDAAFFYYDAPHNEKYADGKLLLYHPNNLFVPDNLYEYDHIDLGKFILVFSFFFCDTIL